MNKLNLDEIKVVDFPREQYYQAVHNKKQIYIHHTVSGPGVMGDINWWEQTEAKVATGVIIDRDGTIYQAFSSKFWAHHLGIKSTIFKKYGLTNINTKLNQQSIGIEIDSWGGLVKHTDGKWYPLHPSHKTKTPWVSKGPVDNFTEYPDGYRGFYAFENYTDAQIESTRQLLEFWGVRYGIDLTYKGDEIFDMDMRALKGEEGVWLHTSVRPDKSDCPKQCELVEMLKSF
jgi:N-acetyl-anhydromuramyl-L-alanine amidase AmpD